MRTEDGHIVKKCLNGEPEAFGFLVDRYKESVYAFAYSKLRNFHDAEDVTQEVFLKAYQKLRTLRRWDSFHAWIYSIASNLCKNWIRERARRPDSEFLEDEDPQTLSSLSVREYTQGLARRGLHEELGAALDSLPEIYRQVLVLYYLGGMNNREIATFLGKSPSAIKQRLRRARTQLKEEMLAMMRETFEEQGLPVGFTFRIVEAVKRVRVQPAPRTSGLPWGLSLATGIIITVLSLGPHLNVSDRMDAAMSPALPRQMNVTEVGHIPVDVLSVSPMPFTPGSQGDGDGRRFSSPGYQNALLLAPSVEGDMFPEEPAGRLSRGMIWGAAYSPDGKLIAVAGSLGVWLHKADDFAEVGLLKGHSSPVKSVSFSPDSRLLASAGWTDGTVRLWDVESQQGVAVFGGQNAYIWAVSFSPDGKLLASTGGWKDDTIHLWDVEMEKQIGVLRGDSHMDTVSFSPDGKLLASDGKDGVIRLWDVAGKKEIAILRGHTEGVIHVSFSPDRKLLASGSSDTTVRLWDVETRREVAVLKGHTGRVFSLSFSPDGKLLASGGGEEDTTVRLWDVETRREVAVLEEHNGRVSSLFFSPDGKVLLAGGERQEATVRLWDVETKREVAVLSGYAEEVLSISSSPNGKLLASGGSGGLIRLWDMEEERQVAALRGHTGDVISVSFSPDGESLASGSRDKTVRLWDVEARSEIAMLEGHKDPVYSVSFSPNGKLLASGSSDKAICLWDVEKGEKTGTLEGHTDEVWAVTFSPDGKLLASAGDKTVRLWDVGNMREAAVLRGHTDIVCDVDFSPDGKMLVSGGYDHKIRLWDIQWVLWPEEPFQVAALDTPRAVEDVLFSPDGRFVVSADWDSDNTVRIWDVAERRQVAALRGHNYPVSSLSFSPGGRWLASGSYDGTVLLWDMAGSISVEPAEKRLATWGKVKRTALFQNFPNPFNPETWIPFSLAEQEHVIIRIYSPTGQLARTLDLGQKPPGAYLSKEKAAYWDGRNKEGEELASGVYFYVMNAGDFTATKKMTVSR